MKEGRNTAAITAAFLIACCLASLAHANETRDPKGGSESEELRPPGESEDRPDEPAYFVPQRGKWIPFDDAYQYATRDGPLQGTLALTMLGEASMLYLGIVSYWIFYRDNNQRDWDLEPTVGALSKKFFTLQTATFDNNPLKLNTHHGMAGMVYYIWARMMNNSALASLGYATAMTVIWEYVIELFENQSINDLILTPVAGMAVAEPLYQFSRYWWNKIEPHYGRYDAARDIVHSFRVQAGMGAGYATDADESYVFWSLEASTKIVNMPGFGLPGRFSKLAWDGNRTRFYYCLRRDFERLRESTLVMEADLLAWYWQDIDRARSGSGAAAGDNLIVGLTTAFEISRTTSRYKSERGVEGTGIGSGGSDIVVERKRALDLVRVLGIDAEWMHRYRSGFEFEMRLGGYFDFANISPAVLDPYLDTYGAEGMRSVLAEQGYLFAFGATGLVDITARWHMFALLGGFQFDYLDSADDFDRNPTEIFTQQRFADVRLRARLDARLDTELGLYINLGVEDRFDWGVEWVTGLEYDYHNLLGHGELGFHF